MTYCTGFFLFCTATNSNTVLWASSGILKLKGKPVIHNDEKNKQSPNFDSSSRCTLNKFACLWLPQYLHSGVSDCDENHLCKQLENDLGFRLHPKSQE
eukprot:g72684.t1